MDAPHALVGAGIDQQRWKEIAGLPHRAPSARPRWQIAAARCRRRQPICLGSIFKRRYAEETKSNAAKQSSTAAGNGDLGRLRGTPLENTAQLRAVGERAADARRAYPGRRSPSRRRGSRRAPGRHPSLPAPWAARLRTGQVRLVRRASQQLHRTRTAGGSGVSAPRVSR